MTDVVYIQKYIAHIKTDSRCGENAGLGTSLEPLPMDEQTEKKITDTFIKYRTDVSEERLERLIEQHGKPAYVNHYATLSDGTMIVIAHFYDEDFTQEVGTFEINGYTYQYLSGGSIHHVLCTNGEYKSLQNAVKEGLLSDKVFEELAYHLHMEKIKP